MGSPLCCACVLLQVTGRGNSVDSVLLCEGGEGGA